MGSIQRYHCMAWFSQAADVCAITTLLGRGCISGGRTREILTSALHTDDCLHWHVNTSLDAFCFSTKIIFLTTIIKRLWDWTFAFKHLKAKLHLVFVCVLGVSHNSTLTSFSLGFLISCTTTMEGCLTPIHKAGFPEVSKSVEQNVITAWCLLTFLFIWIDLKWHPCGHPLWKCTKDVTHRFKV